MNTPNTNNNLWETIRAARPDHGCGLAWRIVLYLLAIVIGTALNMSYQLSADGVWKSEIGRTAFLGALVGWLLARSIRVGIRCFGCQPLSDPSGYPLLLAAGFLFLRPETLGGGHYLMTACAGFSIGIFAGSQNWSEEIFSKTLLLEARHRLDELVGLKRALAAAAAFGMMFAALIFGGMMFSLLAHGTFGPRLWVIGTLNVFVWLASLAHVVVSFLG